ncbi:M64 family metallopeptidase [Streptomyces sp. LN500]|uniref:M64 family metallopeptidase n=1 Tax=Streptomyces sp. LN500 TaxID=3112978 RepID=UPI00371A3BC4
MQHRCHPAQRATTAKGHPFDPRTPVPTPTNPPTELTPAHHHPLRRSRPTAARNPSYGTWTGGETDGPNSTTYTPAQLIEKRAKWYRWLGQSDPTGSTVGTYEGSAYYPYGLYRPTSTSIMRELSSTDFNLPGREAMIAGFYRAGNALSTTLDTNTAIKHGKRIQVSLAVGTTGLARTDLRWYVDGVEKVRARGRTAVTPASLGVRADGRSHKVTAEAVDRTEAIRDPAVRALATDTLTWSVRATGHRR